MTRLTIFLGAFAVAAGIQPITADDKKPSEKPFDDTEFVATAASGGIHEVELGKLAASKAQTTPVKQFAERMVTDHTKANKALQMAAGLAGIAIPQKMNADHQKEFDRFKNYTGSNFDRDYVTHMVKDHEEDVAAFTRAAKDAKNPQIREFAAKTLPTIKDHLRAVKQLSEQLK
jgi:putative membrane protein